MRIALAAGLSLLAVAIGLTLLQSPTGVAGTNKVPGLTEEPIGSTRRNAKYCQGQEVLPRGTTAIRIWLDAAAGPRMRVVVYSGGRAITSGVEGSNWIGGSVTVPVKPLPSAVFGVTVCASFSLHDETLLAQGTPTPAASAAHDGRFPLKGRIWIEYLHPGERSWASLAPEVAQRIGFGRAAAGTWIVFLLLGLVLAVAVLASNLLLGELA